MHSLKKSFDPYARNLPFGILITGAALVAGVVIAASIAVGASHTLSSSATAGATASPSPTATGNADPAKAAALAQQAIAALSTKDWATFYNLLAPEVQRAFGGSQLAFSQSVSTPDGNIVDAHLIGTATTSSSGGYSYFSQGVSITVSTASGTAAYSTTIYLVYENGKWYVLGTDPPASA